MHDYHVCTYVACRYYGAKNVAVDAKIEFILSGAINYVDNKRWYKCGESDTIYDEIKMVRVRTRNTIIEIIFTRITYSLYLRSPHAPCT